jgi:hypothetical protein
MFICSKIIDFQVRRLGVPWTHRIPQHHSIQHCRVEYMSSRIEVDELRGSEREGARAKKYGLGKSLAMLIHRLKADKTRSIAASHTYTPCQSRSNPFRRLCNVVGLPDRRPLSCRLSSPLRSRHRARSLLVVMAIPTEVYQLSAALVFVVVKLFPSNPSTCPGLLPTAKSAPRST